MARIDYNSIAHSIKTLLGSAGDLPANAVVEVNKAVAFDQGKPYVFIYARNRVAPAEYQAIAAGKEVRLLVTYELWCYGFSLVSVDDAANIRDDMIGKVEAALLSDHTLGGANVNSSWLDGGEFDPPTPGQGGWWMGGSVRLIVDATGIT